MKQELKHFRREMQYKEKVNKKLTSKAEVMEKYAASLVKEWKNKNKYWIYKLAKRYE
ncbi:hypothetical protein [Spiroplasma tabanidicola]|uniref:Uncharacterized protein n=1 Tax=Spiroplasma tabanidicola TaxID=324079 RepID=A0A6I6C5W3_9MOLU|nr:hypothetical protein [Spiroplasma tabanidicola]QGS52287.1 hypothetical protein STABA_v1c09340 [Spiroplasma tabanidicola]